MKKTLETDILELSFMKNIKKYKTIKIWESWENECLINYRLETKNKKLTFDGALKTFNKLISPVVKGFKLKESYFKKDGSRLLSCSIFEKKKVRR